MENIRQIGNKTDESRIRLLHGAYAIAICAAAAVFFFVGYRVGMSAIAAPASAMQTHTEAIPAAERTVYTVRSENGKLCLYEADSYGTRLIASERISPEVFPLSDREMLAAGVEFDEKAQAQAMFEDFVN